MDTHGGHLVELPILNVAPLLYPSSETPEAIEVEARDPIEMFFDVCHVIDWASFFDAQCFLLMRDEVHEERLL